MKKMAILLSTSEKNRDIHWEIEFFNELSKSHLQIISPDPQNGPDGWPYLLANWNDDQGDSFQKIAHWLHDKGIGLVINPTKDFPDYVFNYGMIWSFKQTGLFYQKLSDNITSETVEFNANSKIYYGLPREEYLPQYTRKILKEFFRDQGIYKVKILMLSKDNKNFDLAFSLESLGNPQVKEHNGICEAISWFLPPHYSLILISEQQLPIFSEL